MIPVTLAVATVLIAIVQIGALPSAFAQPLAAPVLPIVLLAGWSAIRRPAEGWPVPLVAAIVKSGGSIPEEALKSGEVRR